MTCHVGRMPHSVETNEKANPVAIGFLSTEAIALGSKGSLQPVHQLHRLRPCSFLTVYEYSFIKDGKSRKRANFGYAAKIRFASRIINGVESIWMASKPQSMRRRVH